VKGFFDEDYLPASAGVSVGVVVVAASVGVGVGSSFLAQPAKARTDPTRRIPNTSVVSFFILLFQLKIRVTCSTNELSKVYLSCFERDWNS
jgi:hypothetical protein